MRWYTYALAVSVAAGVTFGNMRVAHGELVFEDDLNPNAVKTETVAPAPQAQAQVAPTATAAPSAEGGRVDERKDLNKAELMRRQRLREELKNEDLLTQKLEELRLRDEMKRTDNIIGSGIDKKDATADIATTPPLQEQRIGSAASMPVPSATPSAQAMGGASAVSGGENTMVAKLPSEEKPEEDPTRVNIGVRGGLSNITNSVYDVQAKYSFGLNVAVDVTEHIAFTGSYSFSKYSVGAGTAYSYPTGYNAAYLQRIDLNDNLFDVGVRAYLLGQKSRVRPFVGGGVGYRYGFVNYDNRTVDYLRRVNPSAAQDVNISGFAGFVETGLEFKLTRMISLFGSFKYYNLFSSRQSNPLDPGVFVNQNGYGLAGSPYYGGLSSYGYNGYTPDTRSQAGDALSRNNFYQLVGGVSVSF